MNTSTLATNREIKLPSKDELMRIIENLKVYESELVEQIETSKNFSEKLKSECAQSFLQAPSLNSISMFAGFRIEINELLPDEILVANYRNGDKEIFNIKTGGKHRIKSYLDRRFK